MVKYILDNFERLGTIRLKGFVCGTNELFNKIDPPEADINFRHFRALQTLGTSFMRQRLKQYLLIALAAAALWFVMDNHFVFYGRQIHLLKKTSLDLHDTFVSLNNERPETILKNDWLREAGLGDLMVELKLLNEEEKERLESKYDNE